MRTSNHTKAAYLIAAVLLTTSLRAEETAIDFFAQGREHQANEQYQQAIDQYAKAIEQDTSWACPHNNTGSCLKRLNRFDEAEQAYSRAIELVCPHADLTFINRAELYLKQERYAEALADADTSIALSKVDYPRRYYIRGEAFRNLDDPESALSDYTTAIDVSTKESGTLYMRRGSVYYRLGNYNRALQDLNHAAELHPKSWITLTLRSKTNLRAGHCRAGLLDLLNVHLMIATQLSPTAYIMLLFLLIFEPLPLLLKKFTPNLWRKWSEGSYAFLARKRLCSARFAAKGIQFDCGKGYTLFMATALAISMVLTVFLLLVPLAIVK
jgi:tetratricopeptide (TPR) repeat protein